MAEYEPISPEELARIRMVQAAADKRNAISEYCAWLESKTPEDPKARYLREASGIKYQRQMLIDHPDSEDRREHYRMVAYNAAKLPDLSARDKRIVDTIDFGASLIKGRSEYVKTLWELEENAHQLDNNRKNAAQAEVEPPAPGRWERIKQKVLRKGTPADEPKPELKRKQYYDNMVRHLEDESKKLEATAETLFKYGAPLWLNADLGTFLSQKEYEGQILPSAHITLDRKIPDPRLSRERFQDDMLAFLDVTEDQWLANGARILHHAPIRGLHLSQVEKIDKDLDVPGIQNLTDLNISFPRKFSANPDSPAPLNRAEVARQILDRAELAGEMSKTTQQVEATLRNPRIARLEKLRLDIPYSMDSSSIPHLVERAMRDDPQNPLKGMRFKVQELGKNAFSVEGSRSPEAARECAGRFAKSQGVDKRIGSRRPDGSLPDRNEPREEGR